MNWLKFIVEKVGKKVGKDCRTCGGSLVKQGAVHFCKGCGLIHALQPVEFLLKERLLVTQVKVWGDMKGIDNRSSSPLMQTDKTQEELNELISALKDLERGSDEALEEVIDAIGDIQVTLIMVCNLLNLSYDFCLLKAYEVISKRSGKMVDGKFVKEEK